MVRFWVYIGSKIQGPVEIPSLRKVPGFNLLTQVCQEGEQTWRMADEVIEIKSYFLSPPRLNSFAIDSGNTAPKLDVEPTPVLEELTLPEPNTLEQITGTSAFSKMAPAGRPAPAAGALRAQCDVCGYKNPRDVSVCMKCGEKLNGSTPSLSSGPAEEAPAAAALTKDVPISAAAPAIPAPSAVEIDSKPSAMVEIPVSKLLLGSAIAILVMGGSFFGYRAWKNKHTPRGKHVVAAIPVQQTTSPAAKRTASLGAHPPRMTRRSVSAKAADSLPGARSMKSTSPPEEPREVKSPEGSYKVVAEATPLQRRNSSPIHSPYAVKRRANAELWNTQEGRAIQQVQRFRIYGGQRTLLRNVEILMQILRDREYNTAFESGKRLNLYNDLDWSAAQNEGPVYTVHLTFSGGREIDGAPKKPLHFAFAADLERGSVEPGGQDQIRSNTLHAFFDESRIAPEERRAIAKDTEEVVLAAQPGASPLAFDTVVRQFAKVYGTDALSRVASAYGLQDIKKKVTHDPRLGSEQPTESAAPVKGESQKPLLPSEGWEKAGMRAQPLPSPQPSPDTRSGEGAKSLSGAAKAGPVEFRMEPGRGRERALFVRAVSRASVSRIWETLTGYDRLKQFVPDMLASEREGQDGAAAIVHVTCLTRFMVFVFKLNLHLRIIEHPQQHTLEFEKIAGDCESLRGSIEITTDPVTHDSQINFHAMVVPNGYTTNTKLESMTRRLLVAQANAIRSKAESN